MLNKAEQILTTVNNFDSYINWIDLFFPTKTLWFSLDCFFTLFIDFLTKFIDII